MIITPSKDSAERLKKQFQAIKESESPLEALQNLLSQIYLDFIALVMAEANLYKLDDCDHCPQNKSAADRYICKYSRAMLRGISHLCDGIAEISKEQIYPEVVARLSGFAVECRMSLPDCDQIDA